MISDYAKFEKDGLSVEVNWNDAVKPCKQIKLTIGDMQKILSREDFFGMVLLFGTDDQASMVTTVKRWELTPINRLKRIILKNDMKAGEMVQMPITYFIPKELADDVDKGGTSGIALLDKQIRERKSGKAVEVPKGAYPHNFG